MEDVVGVPMGVLETLIQVGKCIHAIVETVVYYIIQSSKAQMRAGLRSRSIMQSAAAHAGLAAARRGTSWEWISEISQGEILKVLEH